MKKSHRWIGRKLYRNHTDISREIKRNSSKLFPYKAKDAQRLHEARLRKKNQKKLEKLKYKKLKEYVILNLKKDFSPDQIAGRLHNEPPIELIDESISHESIYQYIYNGKGRFEYLYPHLRTGKHKRQRRFDRKKRNKINILERISIHLRSEEIDKKERFGDWETDSMIFSKQREILSTQYERKSMLCRLHKLPNKTARESENAIVDSIESLPKEMWKTITRDNGTENANHLNTLNTFNIQSYFCDPYCSWQKGGDENLNKLVRQYLPRKTDMSKVTDEDIYLIQEKINDRPRKTLNYKTPNEVSAQFIKSGAVNP
ncbi:IS30 family transposase [Candidatus Parcubacteria bacterium]|nr:IS30 family transposase [Candidatus Parcubacteria bacterium]